MLLALIMLVQACSSGNNQGEKSPGESSPSTVPTDTTPPSPQAIVELKAFFPGDRPVDFDRVLGAVNEKMAADGVGARLNIQFVPWDDYGTMTTLKATAGEDFDMFLDAPWLHISQMIESGSIIELDAMVEQAPNLKASIPEAMWESNKFNGKIYGIPLGTTQGVMNGFVVRKDLREKYGLSEIKTLEQFEAYLYAVKANEKDIIPFGIDGRYGGDIFSWFNPNYFNGGSMYLSLDASTYADEQGNVTAMWDSPGISELYAKMNKFYKDGIFEKNLLQQQNAIELFNKGKFGASFYSGDGVLGMKYLDASKTEGVELEFVIPLQEGVKPYSTFKQWNFLVVHSKSKNAELVIKVMDWLSIKDNHDMLEYGIEGTDWEAVGDDMYKVINDSKYSFPGYVISWRPSLVRSPNHMREDDKDWFNKSREADSFRRAPNAGFTADLEPIKSEVAKMNAVVTELGMPLMTGVLNTEKGLADIRKRTKAAGMDTIVEEIQKQYSAFLAANP